MASDIPNRATRRVYSLEELHRLRGTVSQPRLREAMEEHDGEDAELVKEHVLRGSKSFAARSWKSRASAMSSNKENRSTNASDNVRLASFASTKSIAVLGEIAPNNQQILRPPPGPYRPRPSPTPSIRKQKIESLVKAHGSPDHVRVTAGGRIVPSEQSPLCHPRYGYSAIKVNGGLIKFAPNHPMGKAQWTQATQDGFVAQDINGRLCQIVDGTILPLHETEAGLQLYIPAPNLTVTHRSPVSGNFAPQSAQHDDNRSVSPHGILPAPSTQSQINALELEYVKLESELRDVDKTEVLHGPTMGKGARDALVAKRRELVVNLDKIRKAIKSLRDQTAGPPQQQSPPRNRLPPFLQSRQLPAAPLPYYAAPYAFHPGPSSDFMPWAMPPPATFVQPPPLDGSVSVTGLPQNDGAASFAEIKRVASPTQSHAVPIKAPTALAKSTLNPMSPVYKPGMSLLQQHQHQHQHQHQVNNEASRPTLLAQPTDTGSPSSIKEVLKPTSANRNPKRDSKLHSSSISSFETADFFPRNTQDFSVRKFSDCGDGQSDDKENAAPITPSHGHPLPVAPANTPAEPVSQAQTEVQAQAPIERCASPKNRHWLFVAEHPHDNMLDDPSPSPSPDAKVKSQAWLDGYHAGLAASMKPPIAPPKQRVTSSRATEIKAVPPPPPPSRVDSTTTDLPRPPPAGVDSTTTILPRPSPTRVDSATSTVAEKLRITSWPPAHRILSGGGSRFKEASVSISDIVSEKKEQTSASPSPSKPASPGRFANIVERMSPSKRKLFGRK